MKHLYTLLFTLSIILINPWGTSRGEIWTTPKVLIVLLIASLNLSILWQNRKAIQIPKSWKINRLLWEIFLGIGLISTLNSPFPFLSLWGQDQMGDGFLYWLLIAIFTLSNSLILKLRPELIRSQVKGILMGGVILAVSIFPQIINWRIDYTATMGQLIQDNVLVSSIFQGHQPIGLYSHRGHAAFVLVVASVLILVCRNWGWLSVKVTAVMIIPVILALLLTQTRAGIIAVMIAIAYFLYQSSTAKRYRRIAICTVLVSLLLISTVSASRHIQALNQLNFDRKTLLLKNLTSDRAWLWELGLQGISKRPFLGWGFDGFGIAYPYVLNPHHIPKVIYIDNFSYDYLSQDGELAIEPLPTYKAHNLILDTTVSIGILGLLTYLALLGSYLFHLIKSPSQGIEAVVIAYLVFTFTWFDCAQFTHLSWSILSLADINSQKEKQQL